MPLSDLPPPMLAADLESRFEEWRRWCLSGRHHRGQCGSLEGNYRSPQRNMWEQPVNSLQMRPIAWRAYEVELIVVSMPDPLRTVITLVYIKRAHFATIRRVLRRGWRLDHPEPVLAEARHRVASALAGGARPRPQVPSYVGLPAHV